VTWRVLAGRDLYEYRVSGTLWKVAVLFALAGTAGAVPASAAAGLLTGALSVVGAFAVPLLAVSLAYGRIPERVASGRARLTLSLPHSARAFVAGSGAAVLAVSVLALASSFAAGTAVAAALGVAVDVANVVSVFVVGLALTAAFVGGTLAATATLRSTTLAAAVAYGWFLVSYAWPAVLTVVLALVEVAVGAQLDNVALEPVIAVSPPYAALALFNGVPLDSVGAENGATVWAGVTSLAAWTVGGTTLAARRFAASEL
jgi:Cu-processing system permease protein